MKTLTNVLSLLFMLVLMSFTTNNNIISSKVEVKPLFDTNIIKIQPILKTIESNNRIDVIGDGGDAYGILQIHKGCIEDVNKRFDTKYTHQDAFQESCSEEIFYLYLKAGRDIYFKKYEEEPSRQDLIRMWNGGIYSGYKKTSTVKYYNKYLKLIKK